MKDTVSKPRLIAALLLAILAIVLVLQNTEPVETRLLFMTVTMPRAVLLLLTTLVGFAIGLLACLLPRHKKPPAAGAPPPDE